MALTTTCGGRGRCRGCRGRRSLPLPRAPCTACAARRRVGGGPLRPGSVPASSVGPVNMSPFTLHREELALERPACRLGPHWPRNRVLGGWREGAVRKRQGLGAHGVTRHEVSGPCSPPTPLQGGLCTLLTECLGLRSLSGEVYTWGDNDEGQLGDGTTNAIQRPRLVAALQGRKVNRVACGSAHTLAWSTSKPTSAGKLPAQVGAAGGGGGSGAPITVCGPGPAGSDSGSRVNLAFASASSLSVRRSPSFSIA